jgi:uncharacterized sulfatase
MVAGPGWDGSYRVPLLIWGPGRVPAGRVNDAQTMHTDFLPTLAALSGAGLPPNVTLDGRDMSAVWHGARHQPPRELVLFDNEKVAAIRYGKWKYVGRAYYRDHEVPLRQLGYDYLFDLEQDPAEDYNLASAFPDIVRDMKPRFDRVRQIFEPLGRMPNQEPDLDMEGRRVLD